MDPRALLTYWRNSLADGDLREPRPRRGGFQEISLDELLNGRLPEVVARDLLRLSRRGRGGGRPGRQGGPGRPGGPGRELPPSSVPVLITPFRLRRTPIHGVAPRGDASVHAPFWFAAHLESTGALRGNPEHGAWFVRRHLAPVGGEQPVLGTVEAFDAALGERVAPEEGDWPSFREYVEGLFTAVVGTSLRSFELEGFSLLPALVLPGDGEKGLHRNLLRLYDALLAEESLPPLVGSLARETRALPPPEAGPRADGGPALRHLGHMTAAFSLSPSQRGAIHALVELGDGEILALNGPPGTGKTSFLQSAVASPWVEAALARSEPPVILACSTNNQAVTNILDNFDRAARSDSGGAPIDRRWLPKLTSYGLYFASEQRLESSGHTVAAPGRPAWRGLPAEMENAEYLQGAEVAYLAAARAAGLAGVESIDDAVEALHRLLEAKAHELAEWVTAATWLTRRRSAAGVSGIAATQAAILLGRRHLPGPTELAELDAWQGRETRFALALLDLGSPARSFTATELAVALDRPERIGDLLDRTIRQELFSLAARYWEGRWLATLRSLIDAEAKLHGQGRKACEDRFRRFAMLTPCMVSTFHRASKVFEYFDPKQREARPLLGLVDLLIAEEAGQTTPEVGGAVFGLARRALVVGDVHQIEPIWSVSPQVDRGNLAQVGIELADDPSPREKAMLASEGSIMLLARRASARSEEGGGGLWLREHRRCLPEIIAYSNELVYRGRLLALRQAEGARPLPPMGWAHVHSPARRDGSSRSNEGEARAIVDWLGANRERLEAAYAGMSLGEIVGVITPFAAQKWALLRALERHGDGALGKVEAGTVHTFQGAERPVILFSPVYSAGEGGGYFFDMGPNMLNVAVSRAKDSFLVFGDMRIFRHGEESRPSGLLARYLFASEGNEITDVVSAPELLDLADTERLDSLAAHREALAQALGESRDRLLIVSPWLTPAALAADGVVAGVREATARGVHVAIAYDRQLSSPAPADRAARALSAAGARVKSLRGLHNKTLAVDDQWIIEGSFNWLSAVREAGHPWQRHEASIRHGGTEAPRFIQDAWAEITELERRG